jgi:phosphopantetheinyl transferase
MNIIEIPEDWRGRAIVVAEAAVPLAWFSEEELRAAEGFKLARRRDEFLLSRAAAKKLAVDLGAAEGVAEIRIEQRRIGAMHLSISHSAPYAAAAIDAIPVGIDVQVVRSIRESAAHLFLSEQESAVMQRCGVPDRLIHFWCAKEAEWKRRGGEVETLKRVPLTLEEETSLGLRFDTVDTLRIGDLVVALTRPTS